MGQNGVPIKEKSKRGATTGQGRGTLDASQASTGKTNYGRSGTVKHQNNNTSSSKPGKHDSTSAHNTGTGPL